ncbi:MAG: TetR/AcrR family transcriptional regulator [Dehalococcoidia bacterium]
MADAALRERVLAEARARLAAGAVPTPDELAAAVGISRRSYYRLVGGSHRAFLREAGYIAEPDARARLLDAAAAMLDEVGFARLLMDAVAARAAVSRATLYRLFPGKAELLAALAESRAPLPALDRFLTAAADRPAVEALPELVTAAIPRLLAQRGVLRAVMAEAILAGPESAPARAVLAGTYAALTDYLRGQMAAGQLRQTDPLTAVQALVGPLLLAVAVQPQFWAEVGGTAATPEETIAGLVQIWLHGLQPDPPATS